MVQPLQYLILKGGARLENDSLGAALIRGGALSKGGALSRKCGTHSSAIISWWGNTLQKEYMVENKKLYELSEYLLSLNITQVHSGVIMDQFYIHGLGNQ